MNPTFEKYIRIKCPAFCAEEEDEIVYGLSPFASQSSVCRAGLMAGIYNNAYGGYIIVSFSEAQDFF